MAQQMQWSTQENRCAPDPFATRRMIDQLLAMQLRITRVPLVPVIASAPPPLVAPRGVAILEFTSDCSNFITYAFP